MAQFGRTHSYSDIFRSLHPQVLESKPLTRRFQKDLLIFWEFDRSGVLGAISAQGRPSWTHQSKDLWSPATVHLFSIDHRLALLVSKNPRDSVSLD